MKLRQRQFLIRAVRAPLSDLTARSAFLSSQSNVYLSLKLFWIAATRLAAFGCFRRSFALITAVQPDRVGTIATCMPGGQSKKRAVSSPFEMRVLAISAPLPPACWPEPRSGRRPALYRRPGRETRTTPAQDRAETVWGLVPLGERPLTPYPGLWSLQYGPSGTGGSQFRIDYFAGGVSMSDELASAVDLSLFVSDGHVFHSLSQKSDRSIQRIFLRGLCHSVRRFTSPIGN